MRRALWVLMVAAAGCRSVPALPPATLAQLAGTPGGYLTGEVMDLRQEALLDNRDFVYAIALSPDGTKAAFTHLGLRAFDLGLWGLQPPRPLASVPLNIHDFDVEGLAFSPDGRAVCTAARDGVLRCFSASDGTALGTYITEEPLVTVAFLASGRAVVTGSARGLLTVVDYPGLTFASELRAHRDEVRSLAVGPEGQVYSGGWDKSIAVLEPVEREDAARMARVAFERRGGVTAVHGQLNGRAPLAMALDARVSQVVLTREAGRAAGLDAAALPETVSLPTALGTIQAPLARGQRMAFKGLFATVDVALCDACVPPGAQGVLGAPFTDRFEVAFDESTGEAVLTPRAPEAASPRRAFALEPRARMTFDGYVNDFSLDRSGRWLGVAFSEEKAQRTREIYQREKQHEPEPPREGDASAVVDARTGAVVKRWHAHRGVVSTAAISPDGRTLATGGWDKAIYLFGVDAPEPIARRELGWSLRRLRFSEDGRRLAAGAWTPQNPVGDQQSAPSALVYEPVYRAAGVREPDPRRSARSLQSFR